MELKYLRGPDQVFRICSNVIGIENQLELPTATEEKSAIE